MSESMINVPHINGTEFPAVRSVFEFIHNSAIVSADRLGRDPVEYNRKVEALLETMTDDLYVGVVAAIAIISHVTDHLENTYKARAKAKSKTRRSH